MCTSCHEPKLTLQRAVLRDPAACLPRQRFATGDRPRARWRHADHALAGQSRSRRAVCRSTSSCRRPPSCQHARASVQGQHKARPHGRAGQCAAQRGKNARVGGGGGPEGQEALRDRPDQAWRRAARTAARVCRRAAVRRTVPAMSRCLSTATCAGTTWGWALPTWPHNRPTPPASWSRLATF